MLLIQNIDSCPRLPNPSAQVRKKIQHYSFCLIDKIGKGYSSTVYKGRNDYTNEIVAIKVIQLKSLRDHITKNLLQTELECIKKINHPHLLKYIDSYETINNCYIVTEFCDGGDLEKHLQVKGRMSENEFIKFFAQFYSGYQSFLNSGFIHRDLKPANIFLKGDQIKIADFGMVKKTSQNPKDNYNVGTPVYMPPESMLSNIYTQKSDVWSIGVMCYQLTHGTLPWKGVNEQQLKMNIQNTRVTFDYNLVSLDLIKFMTQCLDKNPSTRISIAQMMSHPWMQKVIPYMTSVMLTPNRFYSGEGPKFYLKHNLINQTPPQSIENRPHNTVIPIRNSTAPKPSTLTNNSSMNYLNSIPPLQLFEHNQNVNSTNKLVLLKSQRPTMDSQIRSKRKSSYFDNKIKDSHNFMNKRGQPKKSPLDYLISILNYARYLFKIIRILDECKNKLIKDSTKGMVVSVMVKELMICQQKQQKMVRNKENLFGLHDWEEFKNGNKWSTFAGVVEQYSYKYKKLFDKEKKTINAQKQNFLPSSQTQQRQLSFQIKSAIEQFFKTAKNSLNTIQSTEQNRHIFELVQIIDYLTTIYNLEEVIYNYGWLTFLEKSPINTIVECKCMIDANNYEQMFNKLESKIKLIIPNP